MAEEARLAVSLEAERRRTCPHSEFCAEVPDPKFQCAACGARRETTALMCTHCELLLYQDCIANFDARCAKATKRQPDPSSAAGGHRPKDRQDPTER